MAALFLSLLFAVWPAHASRVTDIRAEGGSLVVQFDDQVESASIFGLEGPDRLAIDIDGASADDLGARDLAFGHLRGGQFDADTARIVLDLDRPVTVLDLRFAADGRSLTIELAKANAAEFARLLGLGRQSILAPAMARRAPEHRGYSVSMKLARPRSSGNLPKIYGRDDPRLPLVVIDAGHGGHDPGAISPFGGQREKDVTLAIAKRVRDELVKSGQARVALTRDDDSFIVLQNRYAIARKLGADLFISIHADSAENEEATGATVYTLSEVASDREAQKLAARENKADIINGINLGVAGDDLSSILIDLTQRETMNVSSDFAQLLAREAKQNMKVKQHAHRFASFVVLKAPDTPSVLFETGYLTNADDVAFLASAEGQRKVASGISSAVQVHFAKKFAMR
ncbi:MAG: N-acetylmuramoyl-L-alanine amidase [Sphingorhabdus sp.]|nr:N-acetylmuramoyl-L-alanine amidase [Sphingorhabdus sp.]